MHDGYRVLDKLKSLYKYNKKYNVIVIHCVDKFFFARLKKWFESLMA
jgi:hypothetical protein